MRVGHHLVLVLPKVLDGIDRPRVALKAWHYEFFGEIVWGDFLREWWSEDLKRQGFTSFWSCWLAFSFRFQTIYSISSMRGTFGALWGPEFSECSSLLGSQIWCASYCSRWGVVPVV